MVVFDFNSDEKSIDNKKESTYEIFRSNKREASAEEPILVLRNSNRNWPKQAGGMFANPMKADAFDFNMDGEISRADILKVDARFVNLLKYV